MAQWQPDRSEEVLALSQSDLFFTAPAELSKGVLRPTSVAELAAMLAAVHPAEVIVPRGAGLSYTAGVVIDRPAISVNVTAIDHIDIDETDLLVRVGAGATWQRLNTELAARNLRIPIAAPNSGLYSTVGGAIAQGLPGTLDAVIGLTVVLSDGTVLTTGSGGFAGRTPFNRTFGPDLTGLFIADAGSLGIKAEVVFRLTRAQKADFASFRFDDPLAMVAAMADLQREFGLNTLGIDPVRTASALRSLQASDALRTATGVAREAGSVLGAVRSLAGLARTAVTATGEFWAMHVTAESPSEDAARALIGLARARVASHHPGGQEIPADIPRAARSAPMSVRGALGPEAERWVPVHGVLPLSATRACMAALQDWRQARKPEMDERKMFTAWLTTSRNGGMLFEPMLFWHDALTPVHRKYLAEKLVAQADARGDNAELRAFAARLRGEICAILDDHGATHLQLGRYYTYSELMDPAALALLRDIKSSLDPAWRLNPGVLGLHQESTR